MAKRPEINYWRKSNHRGFLKIIYFLSDVFALLVAGATAMYLYFGTDWSQVSLRWYLNAFWVVLVVTLGILYFYRMYDLKYKQLAIQIPRLFQAFSFSMMLFFVLNFFVRPISYSRLTFLYFGVVGFLYLCVFRTVAHYVVRTLYRRNLGVANLLGIGRGKEFQQVLSYLKLHPEFGFRVLDISAQAFDEVAAIKKEGRHLDTVGVIPVIETYQPDAVLLALSDHETLKVLIDYCEEHYIDLYMIPDVLQLLSGPAEVGKIDTVPLVQLKEPITSTFPGKIKRLIDVMAATVGLVMLAPLFLMVAVWIKLDSPGPVFFRQRRPGMNGQMLEILKFRTMRQDAEKMLEQLLKSRPELAKEYKRYRKLREDPRITRAGQFLRRTSLDELPQLFNVLRGEMSLVGPRPFLPDEIERCGFWGRFLFRVPPGLTGFWQVEGRNEVDFEGRVKLDMYYINNWSLGLDIAILLRTIPVVLRRKGAY